MTDLSPETVGRLVEIARGVSAARTRCDTHPGAWFALTTDIGDAAVALLPQLPEPVDPDLVFVRELVATEMPTSKKAILAGEMDNHRSIKVPLACMKAGRALARGDQP